MEESVLKLKFFETPILRNNPSNSIPTDNGNRIYVKEGNLLYRINAGKRNWELPVNEISPYFPDKLIYIFEINSDEDLIVSMISNEFNFYICDGATLMMTYLQVKDYNIDLNLQENGIHFGRFFLDHERMGAIIPRDGKKNVEFYEIKKRLRYLVMKPVNTNTEILNLFCPNRKKVFIKNLVKQQKQMLLSSNSESLCIFEFNTGDQIKIFVKIPYPNEKGTDEGELYFPKLTKHDNFLDMVALNSSGIYLFLFTRPNLDGSTSLVKPIDYSSMFSTNKGWTLSFVDVCNDDSDEMILAGPFGIEILSYNSSEDKWTSLLPTALIEPQYRKSKVLHVITDDTILKPMLLTYNSGTIRWAEMIEVTAEIPRVLSLNQKFFYSIKNGGIIPKLRNDDRSDPPSTVYLRDRNIWFEKTESVNPGTGKPNFVLPLVGEPESKVKFHLFYNERNKANAPLGVGWSSQQSFIALNYHDGNFEEDENYVMVVENVPYKLMWLPEKSSDRSLIFDLEDTEDSPKDLEFKAKFDPVDSIWEINFGTVFKQVYGKSGDDGATLTDAAWKNWRGTGFDETDAIERSNTWFLATENYGGTTYYYEYEIIRKPAPWNKRFYNSAAFLKRIYDKNTELTFSYSSNHTEEGQEVGLNENSTVYLKGYTYRTRTKEQIVFLRHAKIGDSVILTSMDQKSDYVPHSVVEFKYNKFSKTGFVIEEIVLPTGTEIIYEYTRLGKFISFYEKTVQRIPVLDDYLVGYGPGFTLVSYVDNFTKEIFLRMFNYEMNKEIYPDFRNKRWNPIRTSYKIQSHELLIGDSFFALVLYNSPLKSACLFGKKKDGSWRIFPLCYDYDEDAIVLKGTNFILVSDSKLRVSVIEWIDEDWITQIKIFNSGTLTSIAVYKNKFVVYDDRHITLGYKSPEQKWTTSVLAEEPGYLNETKITLDKFDLKSDFEKAIMGFFRNNAIQIKENLIVLSSLSIHNDQEFRTKIKTYVIGRAYKITIVNETYVQQDSISELRSQEETNSRGDSFTLKYSYREETFKIVLNTFRVIPKKNQSYLAEEIFETMNSPANRFLLDLKNYFVSLQGSTVQCRNVQYSFGGSKWHRFEIDANSSDSVSVVLGNRFLINKTDAASNVKLIVASDKNIVFDLGVKDLKNTLVNYPVYIASQGKGKPVTVVEFHEDNEAGFTSVTLPKSKELSPFGNAISMVTHETYAEGKKILFIYPMYGIRQLLPDFVVSSQKLVIPSLGGGSTDRVTGYQYDESSVQLIGNQIRYSSMSVLPGNSKTFGYFRITDQSTDFFNNQNKLVKTVPHKDKDESQQDEKENLKSQRNETTIFDVSGRFEIVNYAPFNLTSGMAGYIGFENYEVPSGNWKFNQQNVVRDQFALTGRNNLRLDGVSLKGTFRPLFQNRAFIASCWIRTPIEGFPTLGDIVPHLRLTILTAEGSQVHNVLSDVKFQLGDWFYLEVFVDLDFVHLTLNAMNWFETGDLQVKIWISPSKIFPVDVDNVRFSSIDSIFSLNVYDEELERRVAAIKPNGAIVRYIYDENKVQIAEINESNQIKGFSTYTKGSYNTASVRNPACAVTLVPERGFYENFSPYSFRNQWSLTGTDNWTISPGSLYHHTSQGGSLFLASNEISQTSFGVRFLYFFKSNSFVSLLGVVELTRSNNQVHICLDGDEKSKQVVPAEGEILLLKEGARVIVWINGRIYIDEHSVPSKTINLLVRGEVRFSQMMVFSRPKVQVTYKNALNEDMQLISPTTNDAVLITEKLYDELGRQRINVQPVEVIRSPKESLLSYFDNLVINKNPKASDSVWRTGKLEGKINDFVGHKFGFSETVYDDNPLNVKIRIGRPGEIFVADGVYAIRFNSTCLNPFILSQYPKSQNFTHEVQMLTPGSEKVNVFDKMKLKVASFSHVAGAKDLLATFNYNDKEKLIESLPPSYYERVGVFDKTGLNLVGISNKTELRPQQFATIIEYDDRGNPKGKSTPDSGLLVNVYDEEDRLRFVIQHSRKNPKNVETTTYFLYDSSGRVTRTGNLNVVVPKDSLLELKISKENSEDFQQFFYSYSERDPAFRGKLQRSISRIQNGFLFEEFIYDAEYNVISKRYITPNGSDQPRILSINKKFQGGLLKEILYPASMFGVPFRVTYEYDRLGRMTSVGIPGQTERFLMMTYNANSQIETETFLPASNHQFRRIFTYNEAGFLIEIADSFLTVKISYTEGSYTNSGYGDGRLARVKFIARWLKSANSQEIGVHEDDFENSYFNSRKSRKCFRELKKRGYLNAQNRQTRVLYGDLDENLSLICTKDKREPRVKQILGKNGFPEEYGFRFDYGDHVTLRYAKYFVGNEAEAFKPETFAKEIPGIDEEMSKNIWNSLKSRGYIFENDWAFGERRRSIIRDTLSELNNVNPKLKKYAPLLDKLLISRFRKQYLNNSRENIENVISQWFEGDPNLAQNISDIFFSRNFQSDSVESSFFSTLKNYSGYARQIVGVMQDYFTMAERSEFDMKTIKIDANGNRQKFYAGFENYKLVYEQNSNRISEVLYKNSVEKGNKIMFEMRHDSRGNVVRAMHKGIETILYHPVSNRVQTVHMENGNIITFSYDAKGERVHKQFTAGDGKKISEMHYFRDEIGRTLLERKLTYIAENQAPDLLVTIYIYGSKFLVGFVRRGHFYSVISDHQGSVRLIVREGEVVAAYDYMPYGNLMRTFGSNPDAHIAYRYTAQEWDEEIGLYNYHARLYDPSIGRFYQMDPVLQFLSPYSYVYNSPVSMVDPNGKIPILIIPVIIGFGILGAYLYAADANDEYNPMKWDWSSRDTQLALVVGTVTGVMLPIGFVSSIAALGALTLFKAAVLIVSIGVTIACLSAAAANSEINPLKWDYKSPKGYSALFEGFSAGVSVIGTVKSAGSLFLKLTKWKRIAYLTSVVGYGLQLMYMGGSQTDWNVKEPEFWLATATSIFSAPDLPNFIVSSTKFIRSNGKRFIQQLRTLDTNIFEMLRYQRTGGNSLTETTKKFYSLFDEIVVTGGKLILGFAAFTSLLYTIGTLMHEKFQNWDLTQLSVYHNLLAVSDLTGKFFETYDFVKTTTRLKHRMPRNHLAQTIAHTTRRYASVVGDFNSGNWKAIPVNMATHRTTREVREKLYLYFVSTVALTTNCKNITLVYTHHRFTNPYFIVKNVKNITAYQEDLSLVAKLSACVRSIDWIFKNESMNSFVKGFCEDFLPDQIIYEKCENSKLKAYSNSLTNWELSNCAEPPIIPLSTRNGNHSKYIINPNAYDIGQNFDYLSSYNLDDLPILNSFEKCYNCINVTSSVRNIVKDIEWLTLLNGYIHEDIPVLNNSHKLPTETGRRNKRKRRAAIADSKKFQAPEKNPKICKDRIERNWVQNLIQKSRNLWFIKLIKSNFKSTTICEAPFVLSEKPQRTPSDMPGDILEFGNHFLSQLANNGTLLLFEALLAKYKKRKIYRPNAIQNRSTFLNQEYFACEVIELYEELLKDSAKVVGLNVNQLETSNHFELYQKIINFFAKNEFEMIIVLLRESAIRTLSFSEKFARKAVETINLNSNFISKFDELLKEQIKLN